MAYTDAPTLAHANQRKGLSLPVGHSATPLAHQTSERGLAPHRKAQLRVPCPDSLMQLVIAEAQGSRSAAAAAPVSTLGAAPASANAPACSSRIPLQASQLLVATPGVGTARSLPSAETLT